MKNSSIITPKVAEGFVSRQTNLGVDSYDLDELYSPDTGSWKAKVIDLGSPKYPPQVATAPTRYWFDRSRYNNHGTITGAVWRQLPSGVWVMSFDGVDDYIRVSDIAALEPANISVICWAYIRSTVSYGTLVSKDYRGDGSWDPPYISYYLGAFTGSSADPYFEVTIGGTAYAARRVWGYDLNTWICFGGTYDGETVIFYNDGVSGATNTTPSGVLDYPVATQDLAIGQKSPHSTGQYIDGLIGEVLIYDRALPAGEMLNLYLATKWRYV